MRKQNFIAAAVIVIIALGAAFYGGLLYGKNKSPSSSPRNAMQGGFQFPGGAPRRNISDMTAGEIIAKDDTSITVKLRDNGSKIVFYSDSAEITKFAKGAKEDLAVGKNVIVNGKTNPDGSITAQSIQLRPEGAQQMPPPAN